jgi:hypothetical protein
MSPFTGLSNPLKMPLMPAMRPFKSTNMAAATPMSTPPASDA